MADSITRSGYRVNILDLDYECGPEWRAAECSLKIQGHLSDAVLKAHNLFSELFENRKWRITSAVYNAPTDSQPASSGITNISAEVIQ